MNKFDRIANANGITVDYIDLPISGSLSVPGHIALDHRFAWDSPERTVRLAHELGHCETGAFYSMDADSLTVARCERRADKWAIHHMVSADDLRKAARAGCDSLWALADHFGITEDYVEKAIALYFGS